ncbi:NAD(P)-dependent oxidoreductase [Bradyrhizobium diazoefficiens]|nr:NAD(P)-dependent oxidoreductase [Bradyrhizobium diazoefficiens]MBR0777072.1 NAD(P)-dependent oxidoreductase [Bradyrhizobium diazoefficiens]
MKIAVAGASGRAGSEIVKELSRRGHDITAIARNPGRIAALSHVTPARGDVLDQAGLTKLWAGHDVAISAVHFLASDPHKLIGAAREARIGRYLVVGGAGSLEVAAGIKLVTTPGFPAQYRAEAEAGSAFLDLLRQVRDLNWSFLSPSALFVEGERTGRFRLGTDQLLADANGKSWISFADYAIALADEVERPAHARQRFTVGY